MVSRVKPDDENIGVSIIMILGSLTMIGTLVSDIILTIAGPRVRGALTL
jgi:ABC-type dipeptide/oligopeptide/nickel transport system permease component